MNFKRLMALLAACIMTALLFAPASLAESLEDVVVPSAPFRRSESAKNGMVRVFLASLGTVSKLDVTVTGNYSVNGNTAMTLSSGDQVSISFDSVTGKITMTLDGQLYNMGYEMRLRRHKADGESALSIAQAKRPTNLYPGDLQLLSVDEGDSYRLYPIVHVYLEYYLYGVVPYEMSSGWPLEALKAQAVAARTYTMRNMNSRTAYRYDVNDTSSDQVYYGYTGNTSNATQAVDETKGIVAMNDGKLTGTYYTASNGGQTEAVKNAWGGTGYPYLGVKSDPFDAANTASIRRKLTIYADFDHTSQNAALTTLLSEAAVAQLGSGAVIETINSVTPHTPKYDAPSRLYTKMDFGVTAIVGGVRQDATLSFSIFDSLETPLGMNINSSTKNELWTAEATDSGFLLTVARYGHGIGMSQRGAQKMAQLGYTYDQILGFYYEGCERVQYTFTHTILSAGSSNEEISTEPPAELPPVSEHQATLSLVGLNDTAPLCYTASEAGKILTGVPNGAVLTVLAKGTDWTLVRYGEINGYLPTKWLLFTGTPPTTTTEKPTVITIWGTVTGTNALNFRDGASYDSNVKTELPKDTVLCILSTEGAWVRVQWGNQVGYVSPDYLTMHSSYPGETEADDSAMVSLEGSTGTAGLLATPATTAEAVMQLPHGTQVTVLSNDGTWCLVEAAGVEGYLLTSQLDFDAEGTPITPPEEEEPTVPDDTQGDTAWVLGTVSYVNLRKSASTEGEIITTIPSGDELKVLSAGNTWSYVQFGSTKGYVLSKHLSYTKPLPAIGILYIATQNDPLALRDAPNTSTSKVKVYVPKGEAVLLIEDQGSWCYVQYGSYVGYCYDAYLSRSKPNENDADNNPIYDATLTSVTGWTGRVSTADKAAMVVYKWCSKGAPEITEVPYNTTVTVAQKGDVWCKITREGETGYCLTSELTLSSPD